VAGSGAAALDPRFCGATTGKENSRMEEPITLEIFTDYV
jgi:hypothetical protein